MNCSNSLCESLIPVGRKYCSRSCAAIVNNKKPKKKTSVTTVCKLNDCEEKVSNRSRFCAEHKGWKGFIAANPTKDSIYKDKGSTRGADLIRQYARKYFIDLGTPLVCAICHYDIHVEICHLKGIAEFDGQATLQEINSRNNLVSLCRNHHWELDQNLIK